MEEVFADLHVHIGRSENGKPIKITAARSLNFANIAKECADRKGINIVGIIDCASPYVIEDIENFLKTGEAYEIEDGGIIYKDKVCILLGSEVETSEVGRNGKCGAAHNVCFFPHLSDIKGFSKEMSRHIHNITLSTQRSDVSGYELIDIVEKYNGILIPAHCFTPFKSYYGNCVDRMKDIFKEKFDKILLDVPCLGIGVIRRKPDIKWQRQKENINEITKIQMQILETCSKYLKKGGELVYSTCSIFKEENQNIIEKFLNENKEFEISEYKDNKDQDELNNYLVDEKYIKIYPNETNDGFFICKLHRKN